METYIETNRRATGRTYRMLLQALLAASQGEKVLVVGHTNSYARLLLRRAAELCRSEGVVSHSQKTISFTGGGIIYFSYGEDLEQRMIGLRITKILEDEM